MSSVIPRLEDEPETKRIVPTFLTKLYQILENKEYDKIVHWSNDGRFFTVKNMKNFTEKVLPRYFKHSNYASFVRQLNMYDFHKSKNSENEFYHPNFLKGQIELLNLIKRKSKNNKNIELKMDEENYLSNLDLKNNSKKNYKQINAYLLKNFEELSNKQKLLDLKVENLTLKNEEFARQNQTIIQEVIKKGEYTKKLETIFFLITELLFPNKSQLNYNISEIMSGGNQNHMITQSATASEFNIKNFDNESFYKLRSFIDNSIGQNTLINKKNLTNCQQKLLDSHYPMLRENSTTEINNLNKGLNQKLMLKNNMKKEEEYILPQRKNPFLEDDRLSILTSRSPYYEPNVDHAFSPNVNNSNNENDNRSLLNLYNIPVEEKETELLGKKLMRKDSFDSTNSNLFRRNYSDFFSYDEIGECKINASKDIKEYIEEKDD